MLKQVRWTEESQRKRPRPTEVLQPPMHSTDLSLREQPVSDYFQIKEHKLEIIGNW